MAVGELSDMNGTHTSALTFTHARVLVPNYRECFHFYRDVLGLEVEWGDADGGYADFRTGETTLALFDRPAMADVVGAGDEPIDAEQHDEVTLVFSVESVDDTYERLRSEVEFVTEPQSQPGWGIRVAHFRDPAGTLVEIDEPLDGIDDVQ